MDREQLWGSSFSQYLHVSFEYNVFYLEINEIISFFPPQKNQIAVQLKGNRNGSTKFSKAKI